MPLGTGALAGSGFPFDREAIASDLGFRLHHAQQHGCFRRPRFRARFSLRRLDLTMLHLSRLAEDWILYSSEEFGWLELGDGVTSGSSLMPQKKNPDSLELIRGKSGARFRRSYVALHHDEGPAADLQSRHAGGQAAAVRRRRSTARLARNGASGGRFRAPESGASRRRRSRKAGPSPRISPRRWRATARPFIRRTRSSAAWCSKASAPARSPPTGPPPSWPHFEPAFTPDMIALMQPSEGMKTREIHGGTGPASVAARAGAGRRPHRPWRL